MRPFDDTPEVEDDYSDVALLLAGVRMWPDEGFTRELDERVAQRFAAQDRRSPTGTGPRRRRWSRPAVFGPTAAATMAAVIAAVVVVGGGGLGDSQRPLSAAGPDRSAPAGAGASVQSGAAGSTGATAGAGLQLHAAGNPTVASSVPGTGVNSASVPVAPGAEQIRSAQISLTTPNQHVEQVADEVFLVVEADQGSVQSSNITAASGGSGGGYATFTLSVPTSDLQDVMTRLSRLRYAAVSSRTDASQNVSNQYSGDRRALTDAEALRTSLLKQLQDATTTAAIDSLKAQLKLAEAQIASAQATLNSLQRRISYSDVSVQVNAGGLPLLPVARSGGFTVGRAGHDALRVLVVSAGVALIVLAVLVPVGLVAALLAWLWVWLRQRRREHALDAVR